VANESQYGQPIIPCLLTAESYTSPSKPPIGARADRTGSGIELATKPRKINASSSEKDDARLDL